MKLEIKKMKYVKKQIKEAFKWVTLLSLLVGAGCSKSSSPSEPSYGGVDGSGGDLTKIQPQNFSDYLQNDFRYLVRDTVYRLWWLQKNSTRDLEDHKEVFSRFLGDDKEELLHFVTNVQYKMATDGCPARDRFSEKNSDAAAYPDGSICFSYSAFKNFDNSELSNKLLALTIHELSHLRGFDEKEANVLQDKMSFGLIGLVNLLNNSNYKALRKNLDDLSFAASLTMVNLLKRQETSKSTTCQRIAGIALLGKSLISTAIYLPSSIFHFFVDSVVSPNTLFSSDCDKKSPTAIAEHMAATLQNLTTLGNSLYSYESPICENNLCGARRSLSNTDLAPELVGLYWHAKKTAFVAGRPYPVTSLEQIKCQLKDLTENKLYSFRKEDPNYLDLRSLPKENALSELNSLYVIPSFYESSRQATTAEITLYHSGSVQLLESQNFSDAEYLGFHGFLQKEAVETARVKFAIYEHPAPSEPFQGGVFHFDPTAYSISYIPRKLKELELFCSLLPKQP